MPNFMSWSSVPARSSRACAEQSLQRLAALAALHLAELREALARLLERDGDERAVLAALGPLELVLDVAQMELLLRHHTLEHLPVRRTIEHAEMGLELVVGEALDGVDGRERDDAPGLGRELLEQLAGAPELLRAAREVRLDLGRHRLGLDAQTVDPVGEHPRVSLLVAVVDLHCAVEIALGLHLAEQPLQADDAGVLADAVLLEDEGVGLRVTDYLAEAGEVDVDGVAGVGSGFSHRPLLLWFGGPVASSTAPRGLRFHEGPVSRRAGPRDRSPRDRGATGGRCRPAPPPRSPPAGGAARHRAPRCAVPPRTSRG